MTRNLDESLENEFIDRVGRIRDQLVLLSEDMSNFDRVEKYAERVRLAEAAIGGILVDLVTELQSPPEMWKVEGHIVDGGDEKIIIWELPKKIASTKKELAAFVRRQMNERGIKVKKLVIT